MDNLYREQILDHYKHPRNFGSLKNVDAYAADDLVSCGDKISMEIEIDKTKKILINAAFKGKGCAISVASASMLTELAKNNSIHKLQMLKKDDILKMLGITLTPTRLKCALLSLEVLHKALNNYGQI